MILSSVWQFFSDPILQAPTIASMLMCLSSALVGVIVLMRKRSLLGEALSHATYPGVILALLVLSFFFPGQYELASLGVLIGGFISACIGLWFLEKMQKLTRVKDDGALCFILSSFFGIGVLFASHMQTTNAIYYKMAQIFLYGQVATMTQSHIWIYTGLTITIITTILLCYRPIILVLFDRDFSRVLNTPVRLIETILFFLLVLAIVIGIRSVGVVLMSGMLIAPSVGARQWSDRLSTIFILSAIFGAISGFLGNYLSFEMPKWFSNGSFSLPTGPMILLSAVFLALFSLLFSPKRGFVLRLWRIARFRWNCKEENLLKLLWKLQIEKGLSKKEIQAKSSLSYIHVASLLWYLKKQGWLQKTNLKYKLTGDGAQRAARVIRLHRLWEVYLVHLGQGLEKVHRSAEEMEHIISPEIESQLTELLNDPKQDPHLQPIPAREVTL